MLKKLADELGDGAYVLVADLSSEEGAAALAANAEEAMSGDILVNNAGITRDNLALRMKDEDWDAVLSVNLTSSFRLIRAALRGMMKRRHRTYYRHYLGCRRDRQSRPSQLCCHQSGYDWHVEIPGARSCQSRHYRQLRGLGLYRHANDRCFAR